MNLCLNFSDLLKPRVEERQERNSLEGNGKNIRFFFVITSWFYTLHALQSTLKQGNVTTKRVKDDGVLHNMYNRTVSS